jgi:hypothetical protein
MNAQLTEPAKLFLVCLLALVPRYGSGDRNTYSILL